MTSGEEQMLTVLCRQNETVISLLARLVWKPEELAQIVSRGKRDPRAYRKVYNLLDGTRTGTQLASAAGVTKQAMSQALQGWEAIGTVMNAGTDTQPRYRRLMNIPEQETVPTKREGRNNDR